MIYNDDGTVTYTRDEHSRTQRKLQWLSYLEQAGVDNWEGYSYAQELRAEDEGDEE